MGSRALLVRRLVDVMPLESLVPLEEHAGRIADVVLEARRRAGPRPRRPREDIVATLRVRIEERGGG